MRSVVKMSFSCKRLARNSQAKLGVVATSNRSKNNATTICFEKTELRPFRLSDNLIEPLFMLVLPNAFQTLTTLLTPDRQRFLLFVNVAERSPSRRVIGLPAWSLCRKQHPFRPRWKRSSNNSLQTNARPTALVKATRITGGK